MDNIEIVELKSELALVYRAHTTNVKSDKVIEKGINMVSAYLEELGIEPSGTPFVAYLNCAKDWSNYDVEVGFPIAETVAEKDGMLMSKTYEGKAVVATHKGSHRSLDTTYGKMFAFMDKHTLAFTGTFYDCYLTDPATTQTKEMLTKVIVPV